MFKEIDNKRLYPLTAAQRLHFFTLKYCPKKQVLNIGTSLTINEDINFNILKESIYEAYSRCESMRLRFVSDSEGNVMQYVADKDDKLPVNDVCNIIERFDAEVLIYDNNRLDVAEVVKSKCPKIKFIVSMSEKSNPDFALSLNELMQENKGDFYIDIDNEKLCTILFTSVTTGKSKGVMLNHRNLTDNVTSVDMKLKPGTVSMTVLPINHVFCFTMDILKGIYCGLCICINDSMIRVSKNLKLFKPEIMCLVPMVIEGLYNKLIDGSVILPKKLVAKAALGGNLKKILVEEHI